MYSEVIDTASGVDAIFLVPEKESLFEFYEKKGYTGHFYKYIENYEKSNNASRPGAKYDSIKNVKVYWIWLKIKTR